MYNVFQSYKELSLSKMMNIWITLHQFMLEMILSVGYNTYILLHINVKKLQNVKGENSPPENDSSYLLLTIEYKRQIGHT